MLPGLEICIPAPSRAVSRLALCVELIGDRRLIPVLSFLVVALCVDESASLACPASSFFKALATLAVLLGAPGAPLCGAFSLSPGVGVVAISVTALVGSVVLPKFRARPGR